MTETIGKREDDKAFAEWAGKFYVEHPRFPDELPDERRQGWLMRHAYNAGMERGEEKRGCCEGDGDE
ncbi:hypothetical protein LCGC14_1843800 [marine sediment metagenome]|uniref:Uncharacterized protein n=1 Tax=marine sediment metagenome TaxID=412755 RepID=A0A0F9GCL0_9ZZZZ